MILLTSRDLNVLLKDMDAKKNFPIGVLEHEEAWHFFKKIMGDGVESSDLLPIATEVAKKCGGLPIAIRTLATFLKNEPPFVWEDALRQLSKPSSSNFKGVPATVYSTIEWSYDRLQSEEHKQTFLLCSVMGHNASLDLLLVFAMGLGLFRGVSTIKETRNKLLTVVSHLKASCLLLDGCTNTHFDMHDLISDVAKSIASKGNRMFDLRCKHDLNDWPDDETMKECDKIVCFGMSELPDQLKCPKLTVLCMGSQDPWMKIPTTFFKETKNLKVLYLAGMSLPSSISLLGNLRVLRLVNCVLGDIALIGELKNLEILNIVSSDIEMLPKEIGQLTKLKQLDLRYCSKLRRIPPGVLCKLSRLEELYMDNSCDEWGAEGHSSLQSNSSLAELKGLIPLTALEIRIPNAKIIPKDFSFEKLQRYIIFIGEESHWDWNWDWVREYSRTLKLNLQTSIRFLNNGVKVLLKKAENLYIDEVKDVEILLHESEVGNYFQQLRNLHIQNGAMVQYILKDVQKIEFLQLESLTLQGLPNLISFCSQNEGSTSISPQEIALFKQKILFPKLEKLKLSSISIGRIWSPQAFCSTQNLASLIIKGCANLKHVLSDSMPGYLQHLKCLEISDCKCIQEIISTDKMIQETFKSRTLIRFPRLNLLKLKGLQKLIGFCHEDHTVEFPVLTILEIENCPELKGFIHNSTKKDIPTHGVLFNNVLFSVKHIFLFSISFCSCYT
ncbi:probable disease resistance protein At4g27220 [Gossypium raimondii]|uniref:probable disease resistance protein At4g27220 n=1 Tax=Gossypium raimondii TaxID=29730 RepID=UPI00227B9782|nr:probable disease resistance protein At4g27220 [Gossypium raimondii]